MERKNRRYTWGILLIVFGLFLLASEIVPGLKQIMDWPWIVMGVGVLFILFAIISRNGGLAVPGSIISGIGAILFYQNLSGNWDTWTFAWTLIPGFVGIGIGLATLISPKEQRDGWSASLFLIALSMVMFVVFGGNQFLGWNLQFLWPAVIILIGVYLLLRGVIKK